MVPAFSLFECPTSNKNKFFSGQRDASFSVYLLIPCINGLPTGKNHAEYCTALEEKTWETAALLEVKQFDKPGKRT